MKSRPFYVQHPAIDLFADALGIGFNEALGILVQLDAFCAQYTNDGDVTPILWDYLALRSGYKADDGGAFIEALKYAGFVYHDEIAATYTYSNVTEEKV